METMSRYVRGTATTPSLSSMGGNVKDPTLKLELKKASYECLIYMKNSVRYF